MSHFTDMSPVIPNREMMGIFSHVAEEYGRVQGTMQ